MGEKEGVGAGRKGQGETRVNGRTSEQPYGHCLGTDCSKKKPAQLSKKLTCGRGALEERSGSCVQTEPEGPEEAGGS